MALGAFLWKTVAWVSSFALPAFFSSYGGNWCEIHIDLSASWPDETAVVSMRNTQLILEN